MNLDIQQIIKSIIAYNNINTGVSISLRIILNKQITMYNINGKVYKPEFKPFRVKFCDTVRNKQQIQAHTLRKELRLKWAGIL